METIFAVSSGRPPAAIAVVRISGTRARAASEALAGKLPPARQAGLRALRRADGALLDRALVLFFPAPASTTGEDVVELHCHGGRAVVAAIEVALEAEPGLRRAEPGEFTRRALINGRIDLAEAQGLADLLGAETEAQRVAALGAAEGRLSQKVNGWLANLAMLSARVEAMLDFADEVDVPDDEATLTDLRWDMKGLADEIDGILDAPAVDRLRDGIRVVIAGPANAGKSTLLNLLCEREAAIVSPAAGTTRDRIEIGVQRGGLPFLLTDTAGMNDRTADPIEAEGVARAREAAAKADILLWLADAPPSRTDAIWLHGRADLPDRRAMPDGPALAVSRERPDSIERLWSAIQRQAERLVPRADEIGTSSEQRRLCRSAREELEAESSDPLVMAEQLRRAHRALASLLGVNAPEAMLDALFSRFCIGK